MKQMKTTLRLLSVLCSAIATLGGQVVNAATTTFAWDAIESDIQPVTYTLYAAPYKTTNFVKIATTTTTTYTVTHTNTLTFYVTASVTPDVPGALTYESLPSNTALAVIIATVTNFRAITLILTP